MSGIMFLLHKDWQGSLMAWAEEKVAWAEMWSRHLWVQLELGGRWGEPMMPSQGSPLTLPCTWRKFTKRLTAFLCVGLWWHSREAAQGPKLITGWKQGPGTLSGAPPSPKLSSLCCHCRKPVTSPQTELSQKGKAYTKDFYFQATGMSSWCAVMEWICVCWEAPHLTALEMKACFFLEKETS